MTEMLPFLLGTLVGCAVGVFLMCLMQMARDPFDVDDYTQDCDQGRSCKCANKVRP